MLKCYGVEFELNDVLQNGCYESPLGYDNVDCFVNEVIKLENKMAVYFKKLRKISLRQKKMKKSLKIITFVDFVKKILNVIKLEIIVT